MLGLIALGVILWQLDYARLGQLLASADISLLVVSFVLSPALLAAKALRWRALLRARGISLSPMRAFLIYTAGLLMGLVTPGRLGEFSRSVYLRQSGATGLPEAISSQVIDRLYDLQFLLLVAWAGMIVVARRVAPGVQWVGAVGLALNVAFWAALFAFPAARGRLSRRMGQALQRRLPEKWHLPGQTFFASLSGLLQPRTMLLPGLLTVCSYGVFLLQVWLVAIAIGLEAPAPVTLLAVMVANLLSLVPVTVAGFGTREGTLLVLLSPYGATDEQIVLYSLGVFFIFYIGGAAIGIVGWLLAPTGTSVDAADPNPMPDQIPPKVHDPSTADDTAPSSEPIDPSSA